MNACQSRMGVYLQRLLMMAPPPTFVISSANHRRWLQPILEQHGWRLAEKADATTLLVWQLTKEQQEAAVNMQLKGTEFYDHLQACAQIRERHEEI